MDIDHALRRYRVGLFSDADVTRCTGLSVRAWRELIKLGAVRMVTNGLGRGRIRLCDATTLKRASIIGALHGAGFSLAVAARIAYHLPYDMLVMSFLDPIFLQFKIAGEDDPTTGLPPRLKEPKADWFDPEKPVKAEPSDDWLIEVVDGRFVLARYPDDEQPMIYGDLRNQGTTFVNWFPAHRIYSIGDATSEGIEIENGSPPDRVFDKWNYPTAAADQLDPAFLKYAFEDHDREGDPLARAAASAINNPTFKTTVNVSLAIKKALRRLLGIEAAHGRASARGYP